MEKDDWIICRCEEITQAEIIDAIRLGLTTLNEIKR
jgi:NAD(P)H-nitrite reductase large subunit